MGVTPAQAGVERCELHPNRLCGWAGASYTGYFAGYDVPLDIACHPIGTYPRAGKNRTRYNVRYYSNANCTGGYATVNSGIQVYDLGFNARSLKRLS
ncbi:peptidase inhibitor family I36 protein [Actinoplanes rectilineatus]|uniref:peptidase inhibitor family I36 protein n=1 Tax=Actinoplanes rectilineatus TaxID=113571 RepID=UPI003CCBB7D1